MLITTNSRQVDLWSDGELHPVARQGAHGFHDFVNFFTPWQARFRYNGTRTSDYITLQFVPMRWISVSAGRKWFLGYLNATPHCWLMHCRAGTYNGNPFPTDGDGNRLPTDEDEPEPEDEEEPREPPFGDVAAIIRENQEMSCLHSTRRGSR